MAQARIQLPRSPRSCVTAAYQGAASVVHPVAGRLPRPHEHCCWRKRKPGLTSCWKWTRSTEDFSDTDTVLVIGADDTVNPAAMEDPGSPMSPACRC
ncbi:NAD(P)(+) transhydrogenase (Re/Si-specific) subunit beta [Shigella flexneri]